MLRIMWSLLDYVSNTTLYKKCLKKFVAFLRTSTRQKHLSYTFWKDQSFHKQFFDWKVYITHRNCHYQSLSLLSARAFQHVPWTAWASRKWHIYIKICIYVFFFQLKIKEKEGDEERKNISPNQSSRYILTRIRLVPSCRVLPAISDIRQQHLTSSIFPLKHCSRKIFISFRSCLKGSNFKMNTNNTRY